MVSKLFASLLIYLGNHGPSIGSAFIVEEELFPAFTLHKDNDGSKHIRFGSRETVEAYFKKVTHTDEWENLANLQENPDRYTWTRGNPSLAKRYYLTRDNTLGYWEYLLDLLPNTTFTPKDLAATIIKATQRIRETAVKQEFYSQNPMVLIIVTETIQQGFFDIFKLRKKT